VAHFYVPQCRGAGREPGDLLALVECYHNKKKLDSKLIITSLQLQLQLTAVGTMQHTERQAESSTYTEHNWKHNVFTAHLCCEGINIILPTICQVSYQGISTTTVFIKPLTSLSWPWEPICLTRWNFYLFLFQLAISPRTLDRFSSFFAIWSVFTEIFKPHKKLFLLRRGVIIYFASKYLSTHWTDLCRISIHKGAHVCAYMLA